MREIFDQPDNKPIHQEADSAKKRLLKSVGRHPKRVMAAGATIVGSTIAVLGISSAIERGDKFTSYQASETTRVHNQRKAPMHCLNGYVKLNPGDVYRDYPDGIDANSAFKFVDGIPLIGGILTDAPIVSNFRGDGHELGPNQGEVLFRPIETDISAATWYETTNTDSASVAIREVYDPSVYLSDNQVAQKLSWVNFSGLVDQSIIHAKPLYLEHLFSKAQLITTCYMSPTGLGIVTGTGEQAAYGWPIDNYQANKTGINIQP